MTNERQPQCMIAKCVGTDSTGLPPAGPHAQYDTDYSIGDVQVGRTYPVLGIRFRLRAMDYLVATDYGTPFWGPPLHFQMQAARVPDTWEFALWRPNVATSGEIDESDPMYAEFGDAIVAMLGYPRLVHDPQHGIDLDEAVPEDRQHFAQVLRRTWYFEE